MPPPPVRAPPRTPVWVCDSRGYDVSHRVHTASHPAAAVVYLGGTFTGGELQVRMWGSKCNMHNNYELTPLTMEALVFPGDLLHRVVPVRSGRRYSLVVVIEDDSPVQGPLLLSTAGYQNVHFNHWGWRAGLSRVKWHGPTRSTAKIAARDLAMKRTELGEDLDFSEQDMTAEEAIAAAKAENLVLRKSRHKRSCKVGYLCVTRNSLCGFRATRNRRHLGTYRTVEEAALAVARDMCARP